MSYATIRHVAGGIELTSPYHPELVEYIKHLPAQTRRWDNIRRVWWIDRDMAPIVLRWLKRHGYEIDTDGPDEEPRKTADTSRHPAATWADQLFARAPDRLIDPLYTALARVLHPDIGGDLNLTQDLNAARDRRRRTG